MTFISYAQNFEDVALWRAMRFFSPGFYIDVGANDPTHDSVTRAYYERGWRGINIEPVEAYCQALRRERPEDINLQVLVGDREDAVPFYEYPESGLSTASDDMLAIYEAAGVSLKRREVPMRTLTSICEQYVTGDIHFLKIDVEGLEGAVLRGMDLTRWRPWVIVIETPFDESPEWKSVIPDAGYRKVRFDGLNTFYVSEEHSDLIRGFEMPPSSMDDFRLCEGHALSHPVEEIKARLAEQASRAQRAETRLAEIEGSRWFKLGQRLHPLRKLLRR